MTMMTTMNLFDWAEAQRARDAGIQQASDGSSLWWKDRAMEAIRHCAATLAEFTTDDVWRAMGDIQGNGPDGRAMGAVMLKAQREGIAVPTERFRNSEQVSNHGRPKRLWQGKK